jgi:hypothetical protein
LHGASAVKQELVEPGRKDGRDVTIVWVPMMKSDSEAAAREAARIFDDTRVVQFYDPEQRVGLAFRQKVFPDAYPKALAALPSDHWLRESMLERGPWYGNRPEWDIYMFFDRDAAWGDAPPRPSHFVRHLGRIGEGGQSVMWIDDYATIPVEGELSREMRELRKEWLR